MRIATVRGVLAAFAVLSGCATARPGLRRLGRPPLEIQGYVLASAPAGDARQFLARRYDPDAGELGDRPCGQPELEETTSQQQLSAEFSASEFAKLDLGFLSHFSAVAKGASVESVRVEVTTQKRASITVDTGCQYPVIYDAVAGTLRIEYHARAGTELGATSDQVAARLAWLRGSYQVDEQRGVVSVTLDPNEYIAYRVHEPISRPTPPPTPKKPWKKGWTVTLLGGVLTAASIYVLTEGMGIRHYELDDPADPFGGSHLEGNRQNPGLLLGGAFGMLLGTGTLMVGINFLRADL